MDNINLLPENEYTELEGRTYINPNLQVEQTNKFIENYRANQQAANQEIAQQTEALGTSVPSNEGGLLGAESYWTSRYQTPQTNSVVQNLRSTAQAQALNEALANEEAMWKKRYNEAYRSYQKRQHDRSISSIGGGGGGDSKNTDGETEYEDTTVTISGATPGIAGGYTVANIDTENDTILGYTGVPYGEEYKTNYNYSLNDYQTVNNATVVKRARKASDTSPNPKRSGTISVWKLPNGTTTDFDTTYYTIVKDASGNYYAKSRSDGKITPIGK